MKKHFGICAAAAVIGAGMLQGCVAPLHSQDFASGEVDLQGKQLYFIPSLSPGFYQRQVVNISGLGNDPTGDPVADVTGGSDRVVLGLGNAISFYGRLYTSIFIGADGAIGLGEVGDNSSVTAHFMQKQVSLLPVDAIGNGTVSYEVLAGDSVAVTYDGVTAGGASATAQAEFFIGGENFGDIALSYPEISANAAGVVGLSNGQLAGAGQQTIDLFMSDFESQAPLTTETMTGAV